MKLTTLLFFLALMQVTATSSFSQTQRMSLNFKNKSLAEIFTTIEQSSDYSFFYKNELLENSKLKSGQYDNAMVSEVLDDVLKDENLTYTSKGKLIMIVPKEETVYKASVQQKSVSGKVTDSSGAPLPGVTVVAKGTTNGTITNNEGDYTVPNVPGDAVLVFSFVGMKVQEIPVKGKILINIILEEESIGIEEVVAVGYGVQKKISIVGSQSTVEPKKLKLPVRDLSTTLAGQVAGIVSVQRSGEPGYDGADIWIRGISTFNQNLSKPLVLVDGVPRSFSNVDPEDIESFSVLKDASATAVYGVRGANGVILINTKKGDVSKQNISFRYSEGITSFAKLPEFADGATYMRMSNEASVSRDSYEVYSDEAITATKNGTDSDLYPDVDWFGVLFNSIGHTRTGNLNVSGGAKKATYYVGLSYYDEKGLFKTDELTKYDSAIRFKRYNMTSNLSLKPTATTNIILGVQGYLANGNYPGTGTGTIFSRAFQETPIIHPAKYSDGTIPDTRNGSLMNPYACLTQTGYANQWRNQLFSNLRVIQELPFITKGLSFSAMFSFDAYNYVSLRRTKVPDTFLATGRDADGNLIYEQTAVGTEYLDYNRVNSGSRKIYEEIKLNYQRQFKEHNVTAMFLFNQSDEINTQASTFINSLPYRYRGLAGRTTYSFHDKYFGEFNFGYNGSENFAPNKRFGFFPSVGLGWIVSQESFFEPIKNIIQFAKIRFSYGKVGNSEISGQRFAYISTINESATGYTYGKNLDNGIGGLAISEFGTDVSWETSKKTNIGIDLWLLKESFKVQIDLFKDNREGIFLRRSSIPSYVGIINNPYGNVGEIHNKGIDGSFTYQTKIGDLDLSLLGNFTFSRNEVIKDGLPKWQYPWLERKGQRVDQRYGYIALGLFESEEEIANSPHQTGDVRPGDIKFKDLNSDGVINSYDEAPIGFGAIPEIVYGFGFSLGYKAFSLSALFQGVGNVDILLSGEGLIPFEQGLSRGNLFSNISDHWSVENTDPNAFYPRLSVGTINENYSTNSWWLKSGNYLRLKNIQLSYTLSKSIQKKLHTKNASIFVSGVNVFTMSQFKLWDVELGDGKGANYPNISTYSVGFSVNF